MQQGGLAAPQEKDVSKRVLQQLKAEGVERAALHTYQGGAGRKGEGQGELLFVIVQKGGLAAAQKKHVARRDILKKLEAQRVEGAAFYT